MPTVDEQREQLITQMLQATTEEECAVARQAAKAWLSEHPDDERVLQAGEQLVMMQSSYEWERRQQELRRSRGGVR